MTRQAYYLYGRQDSDEKIVQQHFLAEESQKRDIASLAVKKNASAPHWYTVAEVQKNLRDDEVYVGIYALRPRETDRRSYFAWIIARDGPVRTIDLGDAQIIDDQVKVFLRELERVPSIAPGEEKYAEERLKNKCLVELSRRVLHPIQKLAGARKRWVISPDGPLWNLPWAALLLPVFAALADALQMASANPAALLGVNSQHGLLAAGWPANLILFQWDAPSTTLTIAGTLSGGELVYDSAHH